MRYFFLLLGDRNDEMAPGSPEWDAEMAGYQAFDDRYGAAIVGGEALHGATAATTVRAAGGAPLVTDGPFAETAEVSGGFYVIDADSLDDAIEMAARIPAAAGRNGGIEVRPTVEHFDAFPDGDPGPGEGEHRWLALLWGKQTDADVPGTPAWDEGAAAHGRFGEEAGDALRAGAAFHPAAVATTVRVRDGEVVVTDGPFSETAEVVGGYYQFTARTRQDAVALAERIPAEAVELWPIVELG
jgi:hypothetical protein